MKRNVIIILSVAALLIAGVSLLLLRRAARVAPVPSSKKQFVIVSPPPKIKTLPTVPAGTSFTYAGTKKAPASLAQYSVSQTTSTDALRRAALDYSTKLGFTATPSSAIIKDSFVFMREQPPLYFTFTKTNATVAMTYQKDLAADPGNPLISGEDTARAFLAALSIIPSSYEITYLGADEHSVEGVGVLDNPPPVLTKLLFGISIGGIEVFTPEYSPSWALLITDDRSRVRMATIVVPYTIGAPLRQAPLIDPADAVANLNAQNGALLGVASTTGNTFDAKLEFTSGTVSDFTLAYVNVSGVLTPAYILHGVGKTSTGATQAFDALVLATAQ